MDDLVGRNKGKAGGGKRLGANSSFNSACWIAALSALVNWRSSAACNNSSNLLSSMARATSSNWPRYSPPTYNWGNSLIRPNDLPALLHFLAYCRAASLWATSTSWNLIWLVWSNCWICSWLRLIYSPKKILKKKCQFFKCIHLHHYVMYLQQHCHWRRKSRLAPSWDPKGSKQALDFGRRAYCQAHATRSYSYFRQEKE